MQIYKATVFISFIVGFVVSDNLTEIVDLNQGKLLNPKLLQDLVANESTTKKDPNDPPVVHADTSVALNASISSLKSISETTSKHDIITLVTSVTITIIEKAKPTHSSKRHGQKSGSSGKNILNNAPPPNVIAISPQFINHGVAEDHSIPAAVYAKPRVSWDQIKQESEPEKNTILEQDGYVYEYIYEDEDPEIDKGKESEKDRSEDPQKYGSEDSERDGVEDLKKEIGEDLKHEIGDDLTSERVQDQLNDIDASMIKIQDLGNSNYSTISTNIHSERVVKKQKTTKISLADGSSTSTKMVSSVSPILTSPTSTSLFPYFNNSSRTVYNATTDRNSSRIFPFSKVSLHRHASSSRTGESLQHLADDSKIKSLLHWFHISSASSRYSIRIHIFLMSLAALILFL